MAEAITGLTIGALGAILTIRNGIERFINDLDHYKNFSDRLIPILSQLATITINVETWKCFWHIHENTSFSLYIAYWGHNGAKLIVEQLSDIRLKIFKVTQQFESIYPQVAATFDRTILPETRFSEHNEVETLRLSLRKYTARVGWRFKLAGLVRIPALQESLKLLEDSAKDLERLSQSQFIKAVSKNKNDSHLETLKEKVALHEYLVRLAQSPALASDALKPRNVYLDMRLDYQTTPDNRMMAIGRFAGEGMLPLYVRAQDSNSRIKIDVCIKEARSQSISNHSIVPVADDLHHALTQLSTEDGCSMYQFRDKSGTHTFTVQKTTALSSDTASLRRLLAHGHNLGGPCLFRTSEKLKLGYQLVECALPLLRTSWLSNLCSCAIRRTTDRENLYAIRFGQKQHYEPRSGMSISDAWCKEDWQRMQIRRIGVLLTEIATGKNVVEASFNRETGRVRIYFDEINLERDQASNDCTNDAQIAARVEEGAGQDFREAVDYCLREPLATDIDVEELGSFFHNVIDP